MELLHDAVVVSLEETAGEGEQNTGSVEMEEEKAFRKGWELNREIGQRIRALRLSYNLSMDELSNLLEITPGFLGLVERGERGATIERLTALGRIFRVSLDYLVLGLESTPIKRTDDSIKFLEGVLNERELSKLAELGKSLSMFQYNSKELDLLFDALHYQLKFFHNTKS